MKHVIGYSAILISISILFLSFYLMSDNFNYNFPGFMVLALGFAFFIFSGLLLDAMRDDEAS